MENQKPQILLTNDDGILSPGLWAAAASLSRLGFVTVTAPRDQCSGMGRSLPSTSDGIIEEKQVEVNDQAWTVYSVGGSPAQTVLYGILDVMKHKPDLVVSGINYGENVATGVTISGTVGAALEGAALGIPSLAVSLEAAPELHLTYSEDNHHFMSRERIALMKEGAFLINTARGSLVDEEALYDALTSGRLAGAALDCFEEEPYHGPLKDLENVLLSAHIGSYAKEARVLMERQAAENLLRELTKIGVIV